MVFITDVGVSFLFALPILVSNAVPAILGGGYPVDGYKVLKDGKRMLGDNKTLWGLFYGILSGFLIGVIVWFLASDLFMVQYGINYPFWIGALMGFGCNFGDMFGSFVKRRINISSGGSFPIFDQVGYILFGLLWSWPVFGTLPWEFWLSLLVFAPLLHIGTNVLAYSLKIKDVPW
jgi:CDP-2,3-bis-(O-geranylgeranyl)-sn-glycerol synthase